MNELYISKLVPGDDDDEDVKKARLEKSMTSSLPMWLVRPVVHNEEYISQESLGIPKSLHWKGVAVMWQFGRVKEPEHYGPVERDDVHVLSDTMRCTSSSYVRDHFKTFTVAVDIAIPELLWDPSLKPPK